MTQLITAVYEHGVLRPLKRLHLAENQTVQLQIVTEPNPDATQMSPKPISISYWHKSGIWTFNTSARTHRPIPLLPGRTPASRRLFLRPRDGDSLSQLIIEDQGDLIDSTFLISSALVNATSPRSGHSALGPKT